MRAMKQLKEYKSARYVHEGGPEGEGIVKELRPLVPAGLKDKFAKNLIDAWNRDHELIRSSKVIMSNGTVQHKEIIHLDSYLSTMTPSINDMDEHSTQSNIMDYPLVYQRRLSDAEKEPVDLEEEEEEETIDPEQSEEEDLTVHSDVYEFCRYESYQVVKKYVQLGLPISVVFVKLTSGEVKMRSVVG